MGMTTIIQTTGLRKFIIKYNNIPILSRYLFLNMGRWELRKKQGVSYSILVKPKKKN
jgi:hypothetical protein